ncbi:MAG: 3-hydroxybutyryl-CoA dehydrogenase [Planctomycetota bacterium]|nr:3-hydroxybutyryl-CoA dehydrogenase [Planctomycetota bacterium]
MSTPLFPRVGVIGAGTMGNGIAQVFATAGAEVLMIDANPEAGARGRATIEASLARLVKKERLTAEVAAEILGRVAVGTSIAELTDQGLVVEAVVERKDVKCAVLAELDQHMPAETILATNTSSISITELAAVTGRADRVIGMHFMNPVPIMTLVEVIRGQETSDATASAVVECSRALGKEPVEANDYPGFVSNRVLMPMINEAVFCLMEGVATREGIDTVMKLGMAHPMGPLTLADLIGLDVCLDILEVLHRGLGDDKYRPCPLLRRMVAAGRLGRKSGKGFYDYDR